MEATPYCKQGSEGWHRQRLGKPTASRFKDMMAATRGGQGFGQAADTYMWELIDETVTGTWKDISNVPAIQWGNDNEDQARATYSMFTGNRVKQVGFIEHYEMAGIGGSPDGLIDDDGGIEIKCPMSTTVHIRYIGEGKLPDIYKWQVQGLLWLTKRQWWDFASYSAHEEMPDNLRLFVVRVYPDEQMHDDLDRRAKRFIEQLNLRLTRIREWDAQDVRRTAV